MGFCAGGYYGCNKCEFEVGNQLLEVVGERELAFFPGIDRGAAFSGFVYNSEKGARAAELKVDRTLLPSDSIPNAFRSYYNGGGVFVDADKYLDQGVEVLASYTEKLDVDSGQGKAAVVFCRVGKGAALLTGPHPEFVFLGKLADYWSLTRPRFAAANLEKKEEVQGFDRVIELISRDERHRMDFMRACLTKLGLSVVEEQNVPSLSPIHLSSLQASKTGELVRSWKEIIIPEDGEDYLKDDNDKFHIVKESAWSLGNLYKALPSTSTTEEKTDHDGGSQGDGDRIVDYSTMIKEIIIHETKYPILDETPYFNHDSYYTNLSEYQRRTTEADSNFGKHLLYGEVLTSTNTLLEKNTQLLRLLPTGFTAVATSQLAGRGRGSNVWVSPPGSLMFSTVIRHPMAMMQQAPVIFVQYLAALAVIEGIHSYDGDRYKSLPIKLKWPNDIYALDPTLSPNPETHITTKCHNEKNPTINHSAYVKIGGILVNSHYNARDYIAVCGVGLNLSNDLPTTSLNALISSSSTSSPSSVPLPPFAPEKLLPSILTAFDTLYTRFLRTGFDDHFLEMYYRHWLHGGQVITLEEGGGVKARIQGVTREFGELVVEEVEEVGGESAGGEGDDDDNDDDVDEQAKWRGTGKLWKLQSDSNSFDFFKGLVRRKL